jgi:hypothetical protein
MPRQDIQLALIRPVFGTLDQSVLDRIFPQVQPLLVIAFTSAELAIKKVLLPDRFFIWVRPVARCVGSPELYPVFQQRDWMPRRCAEHMHVIGHENVTADKPMIGLLPRRNEQLLDFGPGQQRSALRDAYRDELDNRLVWEFECCEMRQGAATRDRGKLPCSRFK